jgi:hypothetical protein
MGRSKQRKIDDVSIWFDTAAAEGSGTDSDIFLKFYNEDDEQIGWLEVYERSDLKGFEAGMLNYGDVGNLRDNPWMQQLKDDVARVSVEISDITDVESSWFPEYIALDFCQDANNENSLIYLWYLHRTIRTEEEHLFDVTERYIGDIRNLFTQPDWRTVDVSAGQG